MECVDKLIRKSDMLCPISGKKLKESDIIPVVRVRWYVVVGLYSI